MRRSHPTPKGAPFIIRFRQSCSTLLRLEHNILRRGPRGRWQLRERRNFSDEERCSIPSIFVIVIVIRTQVQEVPKVEVGVQYSALNIPSSRVGCVGCQVYNHGVGGRFVANFHRALSFDSEFIFQMRALGHRTWKAVVLPRGFSAYYRFAPSNRVSS